MINLLKKFVLALVIVLGVLNFTCFAESDFVIKPKGEFYEYSENPTKVAEILGIKENELKNISENSVLYIAVNEENTKQIRLTQGQNSFTYSIVNISNLTDDKIKVLLPQITGIEGIKGEIINKDGQKFIKTVLRSSDSGGDYILTEYITVADKKSYVLSFYTAIDEDTDFIEETFNSFDSQFFLSEKKEIGGVLKYLLPVSTVIFALIAIGIGVTVLLDLRKKRVATDEDVQDSDMQSESPDGEVEDIE